MDDDYLFNGLMQEACVSKKVAWALAKLMRATVFSLGETEQESARILEANLDKLASQGSLTATVSYFFCSFVHHVEGFSKAKALDMLLNAEAEEVVVYLIEKDRVFETGDDLVSVVTGAFLEDQMRASRKAPD